MHYVYILKSEKNNRLYIGYTSDLKRRLAEHNQKKSQATKIYAPLKLIYYEAYLARQDATTRERQLKNFKQGYTRLKQRLIYSLAG